MLRSKVVSIKSCFDQKLFRSKVVSIKSCFDKKLFRSKVVLIKGCFNKKLLKVTLLHGFLINVTKFLMLFCFLSFGWMSHFIVSVSCNSFCWVSFCRASFWRVSFCWVSFCWVSFCLELLRQFLFLRSNLSPSFLFLFLPLNDYILDHLSIYLLSGIVIVLKHYW